MTSPCPACRQNTLQRSELIESARSLLGVGDGGLEQLKRTGCKISGPIQLAFLQRGLSDRCQCRGKVNLDIGPIRLRLKQLHQFNSSLLSEQNGRIHLASTGCCLSCRGIPARPPQTECRQRRLLLTELTHFRKGIAIRFERTRVIAITKLHASFCDP